jgi:hypothetical protein
MPINKKLNILFIHIPKNAGSSIAKLLEIYPNDGHICNKDILYGIDPQNNIVLQSLPWKFYKYYIDSPEKYTKYSLIRDPYTRFISDYSWDNRGFLSIDQYALWIKDTLENNSWDDLLQFNKYHTNHILPQYYYLSNDKGVVNKSIYLLKFENLTKEIKPLEKISGNKLPHINKSNKKPSIKNLNSNTLEILNKIYSKDFNYFNYEKND